MADVDGDVQMKESEPVESIEVESERKPGIKEEGRDYEGEEDASNIEDDAEDTSGPKRPVSNPQYKALKQITDVLYNYQIKLKNDEIHYPSNLFKRIPNKRLFPDYYEVIKEPSAISTLKGKIQRKTYSGIPEFVRDFALIVHNAQIYNRPNSSPVRDVVLLETVFKEELKKLVQEGLAKEEEIEFPDLGEIPYATPEPDPVSEEEEEGEDDGEDEDEEEDGDDSDDGKRKRGRRGGRPSVGGRKGTREDEEDKGDEDGRKRRGRPPKVDTPMEARIKAIIKGLRKVKDKTGRVKILPFERLPDKAEYPDYYQTIREPIAMDTIKKKAKRKKYQSLEQFVADIDLMFKNATDFNEDGSQLYQDALELREEAHKLLETEKAKPDDEYLMEDGRLPLPDGILYKGEVWKVGDWIHIQNPNDVTKPVVAQIYRTWQDTDGQKWINACWYYRPEQTIHQYEKHFFPNEVVKTGQYRDHHIEELIDRCFVMFFTRYSRGRPRELDSSKEVYVCEARYNEEKHKFNKIKTWASCLPDEVRDKDYEMDLFDQPRRIKKVPSPLKHLLKEDAKETDELPQPTWGHKNAPPIVGGIHKHARDENQSPPPEPTPPPPPTPPPVMRQLSNPVPMPQVAPRLDRPSSPTSIQQTQMVRPSPSVTPQVQAYQHSPTTTYSRQQSYSQMQSNSQTFRPMTPQTPLQPPVTPYQTQQTQPQPSLAAAHPTNYMSSTQTQPYPRPQIQPSYNQSYNTNSHSTNNNEARYAETYVLSESANATIPKEVRDQFPQDDQGRLLFFTKPPIDTQHTVFGHAPDGQIKPLAHSEAYLAARAARKLRIAEMKRSVLGKRERQEDHYDQPSTGTFSEVRDSDGRIKVNGHTEKPDPKTSFTNISTTALAALTKQMQNDTENEYKTFYGARWAELMKEDKKRQAARNVKEAEEDKKQAALRGKQVSGVEHDVHWQKDFWTGYSRSRENCGYKDDYDNRLPR